MPGFVLHRYAGCSKVCMTGTFWRSASISWAYFLIAASSPSSGALMFCEGQHHLCLCVPWPVLQHTSIQHDRSTAHKHMSSPCCHQEAPGTAVAVL